MSEIQTGAFQVVRGWAELVYFFCGTGLFFVALFGLYQLKLAKDQIESAKKIFRVQSKRASYEAAVNECNRFSEKYFPLARELSRHLKESGVSFFNDAFIEHLDDGFTVNYDKIKKDDLKKIAEKSSLFNDAANSIEGFALYVISGVADEDIAFHTLGKFFVQEAEMVAKLLPFTNSEQEDCKAIWTLYFRWRVRLDHQKLQTEKAEIEEKLAKAKVEKFTSIGTGRI